MTVATTSSNCRNKKCNKTALPQRDLCRVCADDTADKAAPAIWDGVTRVSEHIIKQSYSVSCLQCGKLAGEVYLSPSDVRAWALIGTSDGCRQCGGFLVLEAMNSGFMSSGRVN